MRYTSQKNLVATTATDFSTWHGDAVTDILAATGNDSLGMTGTAWRASVYQYDAGVRDSVTGGYVKDKNGLATLSPLNMMIGIDKAVREHGVRVVNLSQGTQYQRFHSLTNDETARAQATGKLFHEEIDILVQSQSYTPGLRLPLFIIAAGNSGLDASSSGLTQVATTDSAVVLVATASKNTTSATSSIPSFANDGPLPKIAAPGEDVWARTGGGVEQQGSGTSFSAPAVAGIATLLFSFDPSLTTEQVRGYIIEGAGRSGRVATSSHGDSYPIVDAYASLRLAARRPGAPLCGNQRVWTVGGNMYVARDSGAAPELLGTTGGRAWDVDVYHGGKWIDFQTDAGAEHLKFTGAGWAPTSDWNPNNDLPGGSYSSGHGWAHDGGLASIRAQAEPGGWWNTIAPDSELVTIFVTDTLGTVDSATVLFSAGSPSNPKQTWNIPVAFPPRGDSALVAIPRMRGVASDAPISCTDDRGIEGTCHDTTIVWTADSTYLYSVRVNASGSPPTLRLLRAIPDTLVYGMSLSENERSSVIGIGNEADTVNMQHGTWAFGFSFCALQFTDGHMSGPPQRSIQTTDACFDGDHPTTVGGFSPSRSPGGVTMQARKIGSPRSSRSRTGISTTAAGWREAIRRRRASH